MRRRRSLSSPLPRLAPLATGIVLMWGYCDRASAVTVQNCNDHGIGSLRAAVNAASSGDTIDMTQLNCTITLTTGAIIIQKDNLTLSGPGRDKLTIDGGFSSTPPSYDHIFFDTQTTGLTIDGMTLTDAKYKGANVLGGCVYSRGKVNVKNSTISTCLLKGEYGGTAFGGGIAALKGVSLSNSVVTGNIVTTESGIEGKGGGIYCSGDFSARYSTISNNSVTGGFGYGGGIWMASGNAYLLGSTISGNDATVGPGGLDVFSIGDTYSTQILNSTISGNHASSVAGAQIGTTLIVANSTIAFNTNTTLGNFAAGIETFDLHPVNLESSIIALNTSPDGLRDTKFDGTVTGANNLITSSVSGQIPNDTIMDCPLLGRLGNNGGATQTHRLLPNSPALDAGNNTGFNFTYDQRGNGHPRTFGPQTDIGSFEYAGGTADEIFSSEFENRCN